MDFPKEITHGQDYRLFSGIWYGAAKKQVASSYQAWKPVTSPLTLAYLRSVYPVAEVLFMVSDWRRKNHKYYVCALARHNRWQAAHATQLAMQDYLLERMS